MKPKFVPVFIIILLILIFSKNLYSQNNLQSNRDSLLNVLKVYSKDDSIKVNIYCKLAKTFRNDNQQKGIEIALQGVEYSKKINYKIGLINLYQEIALLYRQVSNFSKSEEYFMLALNISNEINNKPLLAKIYNNLGRIFYSQYNYSKALDNYFKSLNLFTDLGDTLNTAGLLGNIGQVYWALQDNQSALNYFTKALALSRTTGDKSNIVFCLGNIAVISSILKDYQKALDTYFEALQLDEELGDKEGQSTDFVNIAHIYIELKDYEKALLINNKSFTLNQELKDDIGLMYNYSCFGDLYYKIATDSSNIIYNKIKKDIYLDKSIENYLNASKIGEENNALKELVDIYNSLSKLFKNQNNWEKAFYYQGLSHKLKDSVYNEETKTKILKLEVKQVTELKDKEISILSKEKELSILRIYFLIASLILVLIIIFIVLIFYKKAKKDNELLKKQNIIILEKEKLVNEINATKDKFFSIIAHDLRNPLGSFKVVINFMYENYYDFAEKERMEYLEMMKDSSNNIYILLENLLEWSLSQRGSIEYKPIDLNLNSVVENTFKLLKTSSNNKKIILENKIINSITINADPNLISSIFMNLISNSIKFTNYGGNIEIGIITNTSEWKNHNTDRLKSIPYGVEEKSYIIYVKDSGIGMSPETISKLFRIDIHVTTLGSSNEKGSGLGLILCKEFIEKHGGKIWVESELGIGSTFYFTLSN